MCFHLHFVFKALLLWPSGVDGHWRSHLVLWNFANPSSQPQTDSALNLFYYSIASHLPLALEKPWEEDQQEEAAAIWQLLEYCSSNSWSCYINWRAWKMTNTTVKAFLCGLCVEEKLCKYIWNEICPKSHMCKSCPNPLCMQIMIMIPWQSCNISIKWASTFVDSSLKICCEIPNIICSHLFHPLCIHMYICTMHSVISVVQK